MTSTSSGGGGGGGQSQSPLKALVAEGMWTASTARRATLMQDATAAIRDTDTELPDGAVKALCRYEKWVILHYPQSATSPKNAANH